VTGPFEVRYVEPGVSFYIVVYESAKRIELHGDVVKAAMENASFDGDFIVISHGQDGMSLCGNEDLGEQT
jgi:hypothetical protein